jgi:NTE family protein
MQFRKPEKLFVVLEGGGAKGIMHVGALHELEAWSRKQGAYEDYPPLEIQGYGGSSIGALIACLCSVGYRPDDFFNDRDQHSPLLDLIGIKSPTDLFGQGRLITGWQRIVLFKGLLSFRRAVLIFVFWLTAIAGATYFGNGINPVSIALLLGGPAVLLIAIRLMLGGLCTTTAMEQILNRAIAKRLPVDDARRQKIAADGITFRQLREHGAAPLRVVATDVENKRLQLFSDVETPNVLVARAVVASMAMPIVFKPVTLSVPSRSARDVNPSLFFDGGLTSNLPVWAFDPEREFDPDVATLAIQLEEENQKLPKNWFIRAFAQFYAMIYTTIFGGRELEMRQSRRVFELSLRTRDPAENLNLNVLDFDLRIGTAASAIRSARRQAREQLLIRYREVNSAYEKNCRNILNAVESLAVKAYTARGGQIENLAGGFRISIAKPAKRSLGAVKIVFGHNFHVGKPGADGGVDDRLLLPAHSHIGRALSGLPKLTVGRDKALSYLKDDTFRYERHMIWSDLVWSLSVPVRRPNRSDVALIVTIDCSILLQDFGLREFGPRRLVALTRAIEAAGRNILYADDLALER